MERNWKIMIQIFLHIGYYSKLLHFVKERLGCSLLKVLTKLQGSKLLEGMLPILWISITYSNLRDCLSDLVTRRWRITARNEEWRREESHPPNLLPQYIENFNGGLLDLTSIIEKINSIYVILWTFWMHEEIWNAKVIMCSRS